MSEVLWARAGCGTSPAPKEAGRASSATWRRPPRRGVSSEGLVLVVQEHALRVPQSLPLRGLPNVLVVPRRHVSNLSQPSSPDEYDAT